MSGQTSFLQQAPTSGDLRALRRSASAVRPPGSDARGQSLPLLLRCALHRRLPHPHRRSRFHQENRQRQSFRLRAHHPRRQHPGRQLCPCLPGGCLVRRRLRAAPLQQAADPDRAPAALRHGLAPLERRSPALYPGAGHWPLRSPHWRRPGLARLRCRTAPPRHPRQPLRRAPVARRAEHLRCRRIQTAPGRKPARDRNALPARGGVPIREHD